MFLPKIPQKKRSFTMKQCSRCGELKGCNEYSPCRSLFFQDGVIPICNDCIKDILVAEDWNWEMVDKICQMSDIPFIPEQWEQTHNDNGDDAFPIYAKIFSSQCYEGIGWKDYYNDFKELKEAGIIEDELPLINDQKYRELRTKWGANYDNDELAYLEDLYNGMISTQNINSALRSEQAKQMCMVSLELKSRIREGADFDKLMASYEKLQKVGEFTQKNVKNAGDFDSVGEFFHWLEKRGWQNQYYDGVTKDVLDKMMENFERYNQRLYTNETGIAEEISRRVEQLKEVNQEEDRLKNNDDFYNIKPIDDDDLDRADNDAYDRLMNEDFKEEI